MCKNNLLEHNFSETYIRDIQSAINLIRTTGDSRRFSFPFIPNLDLNKKIAVVGLETKAWVSNLNTISGVNIDIGKIIIESFDSYDKYSDFKSSKVGFGGLINKVSSVFYEDPAWLNFFAFSYNKRTISKMKRKDKKIKNGLMDYSVRKLTEELNILKPDVIIFSGSYFGRFDAVAEAYSSDRVVIKDGFYKIEKWGNTLITRIPHPASRVPNKTGITNDNLKEVFKLYSKK